MAILFPSTDEVIAMHERLIERFGGSKGMRDPGLLESALYRPQSGYYADLVEMAAAMFESLLMNHPFVDGNKRVAFFTTDVFLRMNGYKLALDDAEAYAFLMERFDTQRRDRVMYFAGDILDRRRRDHVDGDLLSFGAEFRVLRQDSAQDAGQLMRSHLVQRAR